MVSALPLQTLLHLLFWWLSWLSVPLSLDSASCSLTFDSHLFQVARVVEEQKLDLTETEFALLLQACARGKASWQTVQGLLSKMTKELTRLQPETLAAAEQYFRSVAAFEKEICVQPWVAVGDCCTQT